MGVVFVCLKLENVWLSQKDNHVSKPKVRLVVGFRTVYCLLGSRVTGEFPYWLMG